MSQFRFSRACSSYTRFSSVRRVWTLKDKMFSFSVSIFIAWVVWQLENLIRRYIWPLTVGTIGLLLSASFPRGAGHLGLFVCAVIHVGVWTVTHYAGPVRVGGWGRQSHVCWCQRGRYNKTFPTKTTIQQFVALPRLSNIKYLPKHHNLIMQLIIFLLLVFLPCCKSII